MAAITPPRAFIALRREIADARANSSNREPSITSSCVAALRPEHGKALHIAPRGGGALQTTTRPGPAERLLPILNARGRYRHERDWKNHPHLRMRLDAGPIDSICLVDAAPRCIRFVPRLPRGSIAICVRSDVDVQEKRVPSTYCDVYFCALNCLKMKGW